MSNGGDQRCPSCFRPTNAAPCPHCGFEGTDERNPLILPLGFELDDRYRIGHVLGKPGGFGITYLAFDERLQTRVAVKEYLPREIAARGSDGASVRLYSADEEETFEYGLDRFLGEARALAQFDHANIVGVQDFFEANGTAYLAMDYYEGKTLKQYLAEQPEGQMDPDNATEIMLRVLDGLKEVHAEGYLHRDVKPSNIYLTAGGRPILIDFGAARLALGERSKSLSVVMTEGYAPYEQYHRKGDQGPWTDMYGCGATLYRMVTGETPPPAAERVVEDDLRPPHDLNAEVSPALSRGIVGALAVQEEDRPQTAAALQEHLQGGGRNAGGSQEPSANREKEPPPPPSSEDHALDGGASEGRVASGAEPEHEQDSGVGWPTVAVGVLLAAALGLGGLAVAFYPSGSESTAQETEQSASEDPSSNPSTRSKTEQLLKEARGHLDAGRLTSPEGTNALAAVRQALKQNPESEKAQELLGRIADRLVKKGAAAREEGNLQAAMSFFERSLEIEEQPDVRERLEEVRSRAQTQEKYKQLLSEVRSTLTQESPSASELEAAAGAVRNARELRPESSEAEKLLDQIADRAADLGQQAEASSEYQQAIHYYEQSLKLRDDAATRKKLESAQKILAGRVPIQTLHGHQKKVAAVAFSPDGSLLATGSHDNTVRLWSADAGEVVQVLRGHEGIVGAVAFSPDGSLVVTGSVDGTARLWSVRTGEEVQVLGHEGLVWSAAFSPDGSLLATGSTDGTARLWSVQTGREVQVLRGHESTVRSAAFSSDGSLLATGSSDGTARLWSVQTGKEVQVLRGHEEKVWSVAFSPDGSLLATGSSDGTARLWSVQTGKEVQVLRGHEGKVWSVAFSPDGSRVATGSADGTARLWSVDTGGEVQVLGHEGWVWSAAFSPEGTLLATGGDQNTVRLWHVRQGP